MRYEGGPSLEYCLPSCVGVPHRLLEDDYYEGYYLPKGSTVLANTWAITQDETIYKNPGRFWPERFEGEAGKNVLDPSLYAFGFGRRICAGIQFAEAAMFIVISSILASFNVSKPQDFEGRDVDPEITYTTSLLHHPNPFKCTIRPRSLGAKGLLEAERMNQ